MLTIDDPTVCEEFEQEENKAPLPKKILDDFRTVYTSRTFGAPKKESLGRPILCDFGEARIGAPHSGLIQHKPYRAPEVMLDMPWSYGADIWNLGAMVCL